MFRVIADAIEDLLAQFSWRRLLTLVVFFSILAAVFVVFERYTAYFHLARLQKATVLLSQLGLLESDVAVASDPELRAIRDAIEADLVSLISPGAGRAFGTTNILRWLAGGASWFLLSLMYVPDLRKRQNIAPFVGLIVFGVLLATVGLLIPRSAGPYIHFLAYPVGSFAVIVAGIMIA
jgi:hypothetical protein